MADPVSQALLWLWNWNLGWIDLLLPGLAFADVLADAFVILELVVLYLVFRGLMSRLSNFAYGKVNALVLLTGSTSDEAPNIARKLKSHIPWHAPGRIIQFLFGWRYSKFAIVCVDPNKRKLKTIFRQFQLQLRLGNDVHVGGVLNESILSDETGEAVAKKIKNRMTADKLVLVAGIGGAHGSSSMLSKWLESMLEGWKVSQSLFIITSDTRNMSENMAEKRSNIRRFKAEFEKRQTGSTPLEMCDAILVYEYDDQKEEKMVRSELSDLAATVAVHGTMQVGNSPPSDNWKNVSVNLKSSVAYAQYLGVVSAAATKAREGLEHQVKLMDERMERQATSGDVDEIHMPPEAIDPSLGENVGGYIITDPADSSSVLRVDQIKEGASKLANNKGLTWLIFETSQRQSPQVWQVYPLEPDRLSKMQLGSGLSPKALDRLCRPRERKETGQELPQGQGVKSDTRTS